MTMSKRVCAILLAVSMMVLVFTACSGGKTPTASNNDVGDVDDAVTITEEDAIDLVKAKMGEAFSYIPADEPEEIDGEQYYVIYVKQLLGTGTMTTIATYMVKTDGSAVINKDAPNDTSEIDGDAPTYTGEYVKNGEAGEVTFIVSENGNFEMITTGQVNQTVTGRYSLGITNSPDTVKLSLRPTKNIINGEEKEIAENATGTAVIKGDTLTLSMESQDTVFTKK